MWSRFVALAIIEALSKLGGGEPPPQVVVDRIQGSFAVIELERETVDVPLVLLPSNLREGESLVIVRSIW